MSITPEELHGYFGKLQIWKSRGRRAPHKPLLVLWALGRCLANDYRLHPYDEVDHELSALLRQYGSPCVNNNPHYPFWRLQNDGVWEIPEADRISTTTTGDAHLDSLREEGAHGGFPQEIHAALQSDRKLVVEIASRLVDAHFPATLHDEILRAVGLEIEYEYVRRKPRDRRFSKNVFLAYDNRCAVCEYSIRLGPDHIGLEAAHIKWHCANGPDEVENGLALCVLHHRLFDAGAFSVFQDTTHIVQVSTRVEGSGCKEVLRDFHGKPIVMPKNSKYLPKNEFLEWHHREVFKSG